MHTIRVILKTIGLMRFVTFTVLVLLLLLRWVDPVPVQNFRNQAFDFYQRLKPREITSQPITIIDIDERSLARVGQWPWPRTKMAELVTKLTQNGTAIIGMDIVFSERDRLSPGLIAEDNPGLPNSLKEALRALPQNDAIFADAIRNARVVMGQTSVRRASDNTVEKREITETPHAFLGGDPTPFLIKFPDIVQNVSVLENAAGGHGVFTVRPDPDGVFRRVPLVMMAQDKVRLALTTELLRVLTGGAAFAVRSDAAGIAGLVVARQLIKTDRDGTVSPYFSPSSKSRYVSASDIFENKIPKGRLQGQLVLVGTSAVGLEDYRATPMGERMAGVEIHAQVLENILSNTLLVRPNYSIAVELLTIGTLGLMVIVLVPFFGALWTLVFSTVLLFTYLAASWYAFGMHRVLIDPVYPIFTTLLLLVMMLIANYIREERKRREIRGAFGQYVSPDVVNQLSNEPGMLKLGGQTRELTILFSDVRGFTTISESFRHDPAGLTLLMNRFLTVLSNAILHQGGTIDKFMGDAVMAFWNAPLDKKDHAHASCRAAIKMLADVQKLNDEAEREYEARADKSRVFHRINVGIGINSGLCVVGNMGSDARFDYTALGDAVNLASRLEGQSKPYGVSIVLGNNTAERVLDDFALLELDLIRVKGKNEPERIFGLFGDEAVREDKNFSAARALNKTMIAAYRSQDWMSAFEALDLLRETGDRMELGLDDYLFIYETRIAEFRVNPPGHHWDGVYTATSK